MVVVGDGPLRDWKLSFRTCIFSVLVPERHSQRFMHPRTSSSFSEPHRYFGIVLLEALACGLPVAAFPVMGPLDVIGRSGCGRLDMNLRRAALGALDISRERCRAYASNFTWRKARASSSRISNVRVKSARLRE